MCNFILAVFIAEVHINYCSPLNIPLDVDSNQSRDSKWTGLNFQAGKKITFCIFHHWHVLHLSKHLWRSWLSSVKFAFFFQCPFATSRRDALLIMPRPCPPGSKWDHELCGDILFVSVLAMVLSEYWKGLEIFFEIIQFSQSPQSNIISKKYFL